MNPTAIYSKSGKGVQEASGKTSLLKRPDRAVLSAIDGRATLGEVAQKVGRTYDAAFQAVIQQLDKDGFIREVAAGSATNAPSRPLSTPSRPVTPAKPASLDPGSDLDFSSLGATKIGGVAPAKPAAPQRPAAPPPPSPPSPQQSQQAKVQQSALDKAREEAEARAAEARERMRKEAEDKARAEMEAKMRADAEKKMKEEAEARAKADAEAKIRAAREAAAKAAAEAKAKAEAEAQAKLEAERKAREEMERRLEAERKAREEAERKAKEEAERARLEAERIRKEAEEQARKAREEAERKAKEEAERVRREAEEQARKLREEAERKAKEEAERVRRELEAERQRLEEEKRAAVEMAKAAQAAAAKAAAAQAAAAQAAAARAAAERAAQAEAAKPAASGSSFADSLMSDLESFTNKDEEEQKEKAEAEQRARTAAAAEAERQRREEAERRAQEEAQARRQAEEAEARRREEEERRAREEERRKREAEEIQRKAEAATAAAMARQAAAEPEQDIPISDDDLDLDEIKKERKALGIDEKKEREKEKEAERQARKKKRADEKKRREAEKAAAKAAAKTKTLAPSGRPRRGSWGRPIATFLLVVLVVAIAAAHFVPLDVAEYEQAASEALGQPVRIGSARLWLVTGPQLRFENVRIGEARIRRVVAHPALGSFYSERKTLSLLELEGLSIPQSSFGEALFARLKSDRVSVERIQARELALTGGLLLPKPLEVEALLSPSGGLRSATVRGPDGLNTRITPNKDALDFDATAAGFPLPFAPDVALSQFAMKGTANRYGMDIAEWGGAIFNGAISGTAKVHWGSTWEVDGVVTVRGINAAVFAPALLSEGKAEGTGRFSMSGTDPSRLLATSHLDGRFTIGRGTLGSFDLSRAIQTRGKQFSGTTQFAELNGQGTYDRGSVALRNITIGAGALNAGASADITKGGALSGRIIADVRTAAQTLSATLNLGGTVKEPQVRD